MSRSDGKRMIPKDTETAKVVNGARLESDSATRYEQDGSQQEDVVTQRA
jgi:hypothetical protein